MFAIIYGCGKNDTEFRSFFDGKEITYTGAVGDVTSQPGDLRVGLKWKASTDPSITKYVVYWNNKADSQVVNVTEKKDTISTVISGLREYVYSFTIYSFDAKGNKSIAKEVNNVKVYGPIYQGTLLNRAYDAVTPYVLNDNGSVTLNFITPDTINITTQIMYTSNAGTEVTTSLAPDANSITLNDFKLGTIIKYRSEYIPERGSIDTFQVAAADDYPYIYSFVPCDKSIFAQTNLPNDVYADFGTAINKLWDGSTTPQGYPNIFHSNERALPQQLTIDLGRLYDNLGRMEETGRDCCHNPDQFEVWGITDINGHDTSLPANDAGWKNEAISKGWVLLKDVVRTGDGKNPYKFDLDNQGQPIRYIRLRIKHNSNGEANYSNMSEITLWNKQ
ncbi:hypothetical protein IM792_03215 [Mucilaginibacter sp. JRF]|uniref:DUF4998 domain-containing protein n=1 Tax=Mucilaginibacter sp. JRF TaxID=2780088 RepID=UPI00187DE326|nr:DUF4998 domain-containing protein [Mucilaginibacter sp. JRF]MBE9583446.1 hypothetical protein [Mucilaginibacter sp. JRF]